MNQINVNRSSLLFSQKCQETRSGPLLKNDNNLTESIKVTKCFNNYKMVFYNILLQVLLHESVAQCSNGNLIS